MKKTTVIFLYLLAYLFGHPVLAQEMPKGPAPQIEIFRNIAFGSDEKQKLDIYQPRSKTSAQNTGNLPVVIFIHGGGWQIGDKRRSRTHGKFYAKRGIIFVSVNYRLSDKAVHPAQMIDVAAAVKWVTENISKYNGRPYDFILTGHSAGAHLAALIGLDKKYLKSHNLAPHLFKLVVPVDSASFDLPYSAKNGSKVLKHFIKKNFGDQKSNLLDGSPLFHAQKTTTIPPPFMTFISGERPDIRVSANDFTKALKKAGGKADLITLNGINHKTMNTFISVESPISKIILGAALNRN